MAYNREEKQAEEKSEEKAVSVSGKTPEVLPPVKVCIRCGSKAIYELDKVNAKYVGHKCGSCFHSWVEHS